MTGETIFVFVTALILLWIKPGPGQALKITRALNDGFWAGFYVVLGVITGCVFFFLIAVLGLTAVTEFFKDISFYLKIIGGIYFIYLAMKTFKNIKKGQWEGPVDQAQKKRFIDNYFLSLFTNLSNPLPVFFFLSLIPTLVPLNDLTTNDIIICVSLIIVTGLTIDILLLLLVHQAKEALSETSFVKRVNMVAGGGFLLIGLFLLFSAIFLDNFSFEF